MSGTETEILGVSVARTERRQAKVRRETWWCPFCDTSMLIQHYSACVKCGAKLNQEGIGYFAVSTIVSTEAVALTAGAGGDSLTPSEIEGAASEAAAQAAAAVRMAAKPKQRKGRA